MRYFFTYEAVIRYAFCKSLQMIERLRGKFIIHLFTLLCLCTNIIWIFICILFYFAPDPYKIPQV